jgi:mono/diheme cytochrome c family protein
MDHAVMGYPRQREKQSMRGRGIALGACAFACWSWIALAQQDTGPFTADQAAQGHKDYSSACASCHHENLSGGGEAPSLAGGNFLKSWGSRSTRELYDYIHSAMPLGKGGSLSDESYENIVAFLLEANGATPGGKPLTKDREVKIGNVTNGEMPPGIAHAGEAAPPLRSGLTVAGQIPR